MYNLKLLTKGQFDKIKKYYMDIDGKDVGIDPNYPQVLKLFHKNQKKFIKKMTWEEFQELIVGTIDAT